MTPRLAVLLPISVRPVSGVPLTASARLGPDDRTCPARSMFEVMSKLGALLTLAGNADVLSILVFAPSARLVRPRTVVVVETSLMPLVRVGSRLLIVTP